MTRRRWMVAGLVLLALLLGAGAYVGGRLLAEGRGGAGNSGNPKIKVGTGHGTVEADFVKAAELPESSPDVSGAFERRQDNSIFVDETEGGFMIGSSDDGSFAVTNKTGKVTEIVVTAETQVYVDVTLDYLDEDAADGVVEQKIRPGTVEEIGELSWVRAYGEMHGDRLVADILVYSRPPVINR